MFRHIIYAIFVWQLVNKTADCFNNLVFILLAKIWSKNVCEKMENNSTLEKVLLVWNRNGELLCLVGASFYSKVAFIRRMRKKNLIILKSLQFFVSFVCRLLTFELSNINWKCSEKCNMLPERTYDSVVFNFFFYIITICIFIEQKLIEILYEILISISAFIAIYAIKVSVWTRYQTVMRIKKQTNIYWICSGLNYYL